MIEFWKTELIILFFLVALQCSAGFLTVSRLFRISVYFKSEIAVCCDTVVEVGNCYLFVFVRNFLFAGLLGSKREKIWWNWDNNLIDLLEKRVWFNCLGRNRIIFLFIAFSLTLEECELFGSYITTWNKRIFKMAAFSDEKRFENAKNCGGAWMRWVCD